MSTPNLRRRTTQPGNSPTSTPTGDTPLTLQRRSARYPLTPNRFAATTTPSGNRSVSRYTPRGRAPATPYGLRAMQRRAANTPGRDRRRSGRVHRESTFDILRNLGRVLASTTQPIRSSPQEPTPEPPKEVERDEIDELDNEPEIERPRLSLPLQEVEQVEEGSPDMPPPRLSLALDEGDITHGSIEYPRREISDRDKARLSMMEFGGPRPSENFGDLTRLESEPDEDEIGGVDDEGEEPDETGISEGAFDRGGETEDLGRFNIDFNFPSPTGLDDTVDAPIHDDEGFELPDMGLQQDTQSDAGSVSADDNDDGAPGGFGFEHDSARHMSLSRSPGLVGGGLREDARLENPKQQKLSRHGIPVPNLPSGVVKKIASRFAPSKIGSKAKISKQTLAVLEQATAWFFEQVSDDLDAYSKHAGRKTIDESDVITLMKRQRLVNKSITPFSLAQKHLPKELLQDMRFANPP